MKKRRSYLWQDKIFFLYWVRKEPCDSEAETFIERENVTMCSIFIIQIH